MKQIFTFGEGQHHAGCFVEIEGEDRADCRVKMLRAFGPKFAFQYESRKAAGVDRWGLTEIDIEGNPVALVADITKYIVPLSPTGKVHLVGANSKPICRSIIRSCTVITASRGDRPLCQNCLDRVAGKGFGRTGVKP